MMGGEEENTHCSTTKKGTIAAINENATFTNKTSMLSYQHIPSCFLLYFLSILLSVVERTEHQGANKYFVDCID